MSRCLLLCAVVVVVVGGAAVTSPLLVDENEAVYVSTTDLTSHDTVSLVGLGMKAEATGVDPESDEDVLAPGGSNEIPLSGKCFVVLVCTFVLVSVIIYAVQQIKFFQGKFMPSAESPDPDDLSLFEKVFDESALSNAKNALSFTPAISVLMLYLMFRAVVQSYDRESGDYKTLQFGMLMATAGILVQALDSFSIRLHSDVFGNLSEGLGSLATYVGFSLLLWGLFDVRVKELPMSMPSKCIAALALLLVGSMLVVKILQLKKRYIDSRSPVDLGMINDLLDEGMIDEVRQTASYAPFLMIVFFYVNFRYIAIGSIPQAIEIGMQGTVIGVFVQAMGVALKPCLAGFGTVVRSVALLATYVFLGLVMVTLMDDGWPGPSIAITFTLLLLFALAMLKVAIVVMQEVSGYLIDKDDEEGQEKFAQVTKLFGDMMTTAGFGEVISILLLFIHFRAEFLIKIPTDQLDSYVDNLSTLKPFAYIAVISIFAQMSVQFLEMVVGGNGFFVGLVTLCIMGVNVGLAGILHAMLA